MQIKKIVPKAGSFRYKPAMNELLITMSEQFFFNFETQQFELNQNPHGSTKAVALNNMVISDDRSSFSFEIEQKGKKVGYNISIEEEYQRILLAFFSKISREGFKKDKSFHEDVNVIIKDGKLLEFNTFKKTEDFQVIGGLNIFADDEGLRMIQKQPEWKKLTISVLTVNDNGDITITADNNEKITYHLDVEPLIIEIVKTLIESVR